MSQNSQSRNVLLLDDLERNSRNNIILAQAATIHDKNNNNKKPNQLAPSSEAVFQKLLPLQSILIAEVEKN
jgi:hypothetical protein